MDTRSLSALIIRILGVILIVNIIGLVPGLVRDYLAVQGVGNDAARVDAALRNALIISAVLLAELSIGLALIYFPRSISNRMVSEGIPAEGSSGFAALQRICFSALGLYWLLAGLSGLLFGYSKYKLYYAIIESTPGYANLPVLGPDGFASLASDGLSLIIGLALLLGSRGLTGLLARIRGYDA